MSTFIQIGPDAAAVVNLKYLTEVSCGEGVASKYDVERASNCGWLKEGQVVYTIRYSVVGDSAATIQFHSKQYRDNICRELLAIIRPSVIGAVPPPDAMNAVFAPTVKTPEAKTVEELEAPVTSVAKPPRKLTTRQPRE